MNSKSSIKKRIIDIDYEKSKISWLYYIPLLLIVGFVPLIVHGKYVDLTGTTQALFWTGQNQLLDFFSYWKSRWVIFLTVIALIIYILLYISKKLPFKKEYKYYIPLGIYAFFVILSTIFAIDAPTALNGFVDMYQGMWVLLSYVTITFLVINFVNSERDIKLFLYAFIFLIIVEGIIGIGQYFGFDIFNTKFGNHLIIPSGVTVEGGLTFNFGKHTIYGTLFNTNFVGSFAALMLPMAAIFLIIANTVKKRIIASISLVLCLFTWIGCNSRAGYIGGVFSMVLALIMLRKYLVKYWRISVGVCLIGAIGLIGLNIISNGRVLSQVSRLNIFKEIEKINIQNNISKHLKFEEITMAGNLLKIKTTHQNLTVCVKDGNLYFLDDKGNELSMKTDDNGLLVVDLPLHHYLRVQIIPGFSGFTIDTPWDRYGKLNFYIDENEDIYAIGSGNKIIKYLEDTGKIDFLSEFDRALSGRIYIWNRSLFLLMNSLFKGYGPDNFIYAFPQDDFIGKLNSWTSAVIVIDKPHNMYIQIGVNTGLTSLISLLIFWGIYIISSVKLYWKMDFDSLDKMLGLVCLLSTAGYLFSGMFNDQIVSVAPLFWVMLGIGISINIRLKKKGEIDV